MNFMSKNNRILALLFRLLNGEYISVRNYADEYKISDKTVSRDINVIKDFLSENRYKTGSAEIIYLKMDRTIIRRKVRPLSIVFSDYYFYLIASHQLEGEYFNRFYRIDRITNIVKHKKYFNIPYDKRFDEGDLKNKIQYMWPGNNKVVVFEFSGPSVQAILDKLPEAEIIKRDGKKYTLRAKVYGNGIRMFLLSQGEWVKVLEPKDFVQEIKAEIEKMSQYYK